MVIDPARGSDEVPGRHRDLGRAPGLAAVFGPVTAIGVAAVHVPPRWGVFSDAFIGSTGTGVTAFSWAVVSLEIVGALALGISGIAALKAVPE